MSPNGRTIDVEIDWHDGLDARPGRDRFVVRVMAGSEQIAQRTWTESRPDIHNFTINLSPAKTKVLRQARNAGDALVSVTQQSDTNKDKDKLFERNYVTIVDISAPNRHSVRAGTNDCSGISIQPGANLGNCNLAGANLAYADLSNARLGPKPSRNRANPACYPDCQGADLSNADLTNADLTNAVLVGANLSNAVLNGAGLSYADLDLANLSNAILQQVNFIWAGLSGANLSLSDLSNADLTNAVLTNADLTFADLSGANLSGANLTGVIWTGAYCPNSQKGPYPCQPA